MTAQEIFDAALRMVCENPDETQEFEDYTDRAPYLLATCAQECAGLDDLYRRAHELTARSVSIGATIPLTAEFPLSAVFTPAAGYYLSAMLVLDENEAMSDRFFALYSDALAAIQSALPARSETIVQCY